jgi:3-deoxy-D-manno-octulosonic-acid transferase
VIVVDRTGLLGDLYALADAAFVGGGFHAAGLHSVIEPAAFGAPVVFGPGHAMSREAGLLIAAEGGVSVRDADGLARVLSAWLMDPNARRITGAAARDLVDRERGATTRALALVESVLTTRP